MKTKGFALAALSVLCLSAATQLAQATTSKKSRAKTTMSQTKKVAAKTAAKTKGPRFVDGVAILDNDSGGAIALSSGTSHAQTINKGSVRAAPSSVATTSGATTSSTQNARTTRAAPRRPVPPQFSTTATDGRGISLSQYRGRVVLLDFWATWCPPCRDEAPRLVGIYNQYHRKGFEIVGASLDSDSGDLADFTRANGITWRQIFGGKNWDSDLAKLYGVHSIPNNVLIGRDGTAIAVDVHGAQLQAAIEYALAER